MTLKEFLENNNIKDYVVTDRVRVPINKDYLKYLDFSEINVTKTETKQKVLHIYTDFVFDAC